MIHVCIHAAIKWFMLCYQLWLQLRAHGRASDHAATVWWSRRLQHARASGGRVSPRGAAKPEPA
jgi:hypothetical protein